MEIKHENGFASKYFHGSGEFYVKEGDLVEVGDSLMKMGCTGYCTSQHLHLIILKDNSPIDPLDYPVPRKVRY